MYHLAIKPISRSAGRSATAAAAYRAGSLVIDERTGEVHDYTRKSDIEHSEIVVPAGSPAWATERVALWNAAEAAEKRKDARVARDYEVAIPKELSREQGIALVRDFAHRLVDAYGVAVDFNVHRDELRNWDGSEKGWQGYHAHLLTSTRQLGRDGFEDKAAIELSDTKRKSLGLRDGAAEIARVREWWEIDANRHLEQANQAQRIDRRSLKDQGIDREPTVHLGPAVTLLERGGVPSRLGDINREIGPQGHQVSQQVDHPVVAEPEVSPERKRQFAEMAGEVVELYEEIVEGKGRRPGFEPPVPRPGVARLDPEGREVFRRAMEATVRSRDLRVQQVLARAQARQERRDKAYQALVKAEPAAPKGLLAAFQQKGYRQAHLAWERAAELAARLVEQAKRLTQQLLEARGVQKLVEWSRDALKRRQPEQVHQVEAVQAPKPTPERVAERAPQTPERTPERAPSTPLRGRDIVQGSAIGADRALRPAPQREAPSRPAPAAPAQPAEPPLDLRSQAAQGVAAFRERLKQRQQQQKLQPADKAPVDPAFERLKAQAEAQHQRELDAQKRRNDPSHELERQRDRNRDRSRDGPEW